MQLTGKSGLQEAEKLGDHVPSSGCAWKFKVDESVATRGDCLYT